MKKLDYFKLCLKAGMADQLSWIVSAFCTTRETASAYETDPYLYRIVSAHTRYHFVNEKGQLETIEDSVTTEPLFKFKDPVNADSTWASNLKEPVTCTVGNLLFNQIVILSSFDNKFPFVSGKLSLGSIEPAIASRLKDTPEKGAPRDDAYLYVDEYVNFMDALIYMEQFAPLTSWSATRKNLSAPENIRAYRDQLLKEYEGRLNDPIVFAEYEGKLKTFAKEWLKDDPAFGTFVKGKVMDISYKKLFLAIGIPERLDISDPLVPITRTLEEGQPTDPVQLTASLNGARFGSFSRGSETQNGGVVAKRIIAVGSNYQIDMDDCGTTFGMTKLYHEHNVATLVGRTILTKNGSVFVEKLEDARNYLGQRLTVRSPAYCQASPGDRLCKTCSGQALSQHPEGLVIPLTEVSTFVLTQSLKAMHGTVLSTEEVDLPTVLS